MENENNKKKIDIKRITSAILGLPLVVIVLTFGNRYVVDIFLAIVACIAMQEYFNAVSKETKPIRWLGYLSCIFIAFIHIIPEKVPNFMLNNFINLIIPILLLILFSTIVITNMRINFKDISFTFFGIIYIVTCIGFIAKIRGLENGTWLVWYAIISAWASDTFAYFIGKRFGKHKFSKVSPKKSIEGCIGGIIGSIVLVMGYTAICNNVWNIEISYLYAFGISIFLSIISQIGDLAASSVKRHCEIKDYSNLIPGHGGILDRIDSVIFILPFAYFLLSII